MKQLHITGEQVAAYIEYDYDLQRIFPVRPCLIKELLLLPYGVSDVLVCGIDAPRLLKVIGSREEMLRLLKLLDGKKSVAELKVLIPSKDHKAYFDILALLFWYGLLQDGQILVPEPGTEQLAAFLGRSLHTTRFNRNRDEALQRLKRQRLAVCAPASVSNELAFALQSAGLGAFLLVSNVENELAGFAATFMLVIDDGSKAVKPVSQFAHDAGVPCLLAAIGSTETRIGPLILPKLTAGHECVARQLPVLEFTKDQNDLLFWSAFSLQEILLLMASVSMVPYYNKMMVHRHNANGRLGTYQTLARVPGSETSGLADTKPWDMRSSAFQAWKYHCGIRTQPKKFLPPSAHLTHYSSQNITGSLMPISPEYGAMIHALPDCPELSSTLPWLKIATPNPEEFNASSIGNLLRIAVGHQKLQDTERRISPTGGALKSANFFVRTQSVGDVKDGWYSYSASKHALEAIHNVDTDGISAALPPAAEIQPIIIVVISHLQRVRNKYQDFSYNVVHLDAGVATAYAALVADFFGWQISHYPNMPNSSLAHSLGIDDRDSYRIISNVFSVGRPSAKLKVAETGTAEISLDDLVQASKHIDPRSPTVSAVNSRLVMDWKELTLRSKSCSFEEALTSRRAVRSFKPRPIRAALLEDLVRLGQQARQRLADEGMLVIPFNIWALRALGDDDLPSGAYETNPGPMASWKCITSPLSADDIDRCLNQNSLGKAPVLLVMVANLNETLNQYGAAGYRHLLNQCGFVIGQIWLAAHAAGLVGTACGGILDEGMNNAIKSDGFNKASMIGFVVGEPD